MNRIILISLILAAACTSSTESTIEEKTRQPNIILIMADDLGYNDIGCFGNANINTPHLDRLAKEGIRFTDFHSNGTVCSPTRASLMTGLYPQKTGIEGVVTAKSHRHVGLAPEAFTIADFFGAQGFKTGIVGKWHLGYDTLYSPLNNGFDFFKGFVSGNIDYHSHIDQEGYFDWWLNKDPLVEKGYSTDLISNTAIDFISHNKKTPFFLYIAHESPHYPYQGRNDKADRTEGGKFNVQGSRTDKEKAYKEMIEAMDEGIGRIIHHLDKQNLLSNTFLFFCSDNGAAAVGSNLPLKGNKGTVWEGGHRVPAIAYWKDKIPPKLVHETVATMDVFPTLVELVNPSKLEKQLFDGTSIHSMLFSLSTQHNFLNRPLFWRFKNRKAVRLGEWKMVKTGEEEFLFQLNAEGMETENLLDNNPAMGDSLSQLLIDWELEVASYELITK